MRAICSMCLTLACAFPASAAIAQTVGAFNQRAIVVAYYRSPLWAETLKEKREAMADAKRNHDDAKIRELDAWGGASQEMADRQLAGKAPITNILEVLKPAFQEIEESEHLSDIVPAAYARGKTQTVDVTGKLLDWMKADPNTRRIIDDLDRQDGSKGA